MVEETEQAYLLGVLPTKFYVNPSPAGNFGCGAIRMLWCCSESVLNFLHQKLA